MKITMLGISGSGKTTYMSAMSQLFVYSGVDGYTIANRGNDFKSDAFMEKKLDEVNTLYEFGVFPSGTSLSVIMPLELKYRGQHIIDIDWIDYRGGAVKELMIGVENDQTAEILATLLLSDVILVFVDAIILHFCPNNLRARNLCGANEIARLLNIVRAKKKEELDIIFLISKADASVINGDNDYKIFEQRIGEIYSLYFTDSNTVSSEYTVIPIGAVGKGNVRTTCNTSCDKEGRTIVTSSNVVTNIENITPFNIASSFAAALLKCLDREKQRLTTSVSYMTSELHILNNGFGTVQRLIDILFRNSRISEQIFDLQAEIEKERKELLNLEPHIKRLNNIIKSKR